MADLSNAVIGTKIRVPREYSSTYVVHTVTKISNSTVYCDKVKLRKSDGLLIGSGTNSLNRRYASIATIDDLLKDRIWLAQNRICKVHVTENNIDAVENLLNGD